MEIEEHPAVWVGYCEDIRNAQRSNVLLTVVLRQAVNLMPANKTGYHPILPPLGRGEVLKI